jgi:glycosyltransferase involved in cell wall biosynthesis
LSIEVVILPARATGGGMTTFTNFLARALDLAGAGVKMLGFGPRPASLGPSPDVEYESLGKDPGFYDWVGGVATTYLYVRHVLTGAIRKSRNDIDVLHFVYPEATVRPSSAHTKVITSAWGFSSVGEIVSDAHRKFTGIWQAIGMVAELQFYVMDRRGYRLSDGIVCTTRGSERFWSTQVRAPTSYLPVPVEIPSSGDTYESRQETDSVTFLLAERELERSRNNVPTVLEALRILHSRGLTNFTAHLVGKYGPILESQVSQLRKDGIRLYLHDYMPSNRFLEMLSSSDVYLAPRYTRDQGGYASLEAMARGACVIASNIPAFGDVVIPGKNGLLVDPRSPVDLAEKMRLVVENPQLLKSLKIGAASYIRQVHSLDVAGPRYLAFYNSILNG